MLFVNQSSAVQFHEFIRVHGSVDFFFIWDYGSVHETGSKSVTFMEYWNMTNSLTVVGVLTSNVLFQRTLIRVHAFKDKDYMYLYRQVKNLVIHVHVCQCV